MFRRVWIPSGNEWHERALCLRDVLGDYYLKSHLFGDIFAGDQLSKSDREIVTVAALSGLEGVAPQLAAHKKGAVNMGNSQELVDTLCAWLTRRAIPCRTNGL